GIINTNMMSIGAMPGQLMHYGGVFNDMSRVNHSCSPNAVYRWDLELFAGELRALRAIAPGEEITITYLDTCLPYAARQQILREKYSFTCTC
ncbi:SET domain-containing protein, partial [Auriscalpium vulgare]